MHPSAVRLLSMVLASTAVLLPQDSTQFRDPAAEDLFGFGTRFVVDPSHVPIQMIYQAGTERANVTIALADRRPTKGLLMPYRITTTNGDRVVDDLVFSEIPI